MKPFNLYKYLLLAIIPFIAFPVLAQSGSYTLTPGDLNTVKIIAVPANVPIKITCSYNQNVYADVWTENDEYDSDGPDSWQFTTITPEGWLYIYCGDEGNGGPYSFTLNWVAGSYSATQDSYIHGNSVVDGNISIGALNSSGKLGISGGDKQMSICSNNYNQSPNGTFGLYSSVNNNSGSVYGIYSYVYGGGSSNQRYAGYFYGGDVDVISGNLNVYGNGKLGVGTTTPKFNFHIRGVNANSDKMTLGSTTTGNFALTSADGNAYGLFAGVSGTGRAWLQAGRYDSNTAYDICLQAAGGNVGIGTTTPASNTKLDVAGKLHVSGDMYGGMVLSFQDDTRFNVTPSTVPTLTLSSFSMPYYGIAAPNAGGSADLWLSGNNAIRMFTAGNAKPVVNILNNGYVGIGSVNPDQMLTVNGKIHATEVIVTVDVPADYVFKPSYKLMPLNEVEKYVTTNSHLPEIPSAGEITKNGMSMGEIENKLLQKVEELTLYMIDQQKTINQQSARIEELEKKLK